jgi:hypothetical protein
MKRFIRHILNYWTDIPVISISKKSKDLEPWKWYMVQYYIMVDNHKSLTLDNVLIQEVGSSTQKKELGWDT